MANGATGDCGLPLQDTDGRNEYGVDQLLSSLLSQQSENPQPSSEGPQPYENSDELQPPETETVQLPTEESIREETCSLTDNPVRTSTPNGYSGPNQPASSTKPFGVDEGTPTEMSDWHILSPLSDQMWRTNILRPQAQCDPTRGVLCVEQNMHKNMKQTVQSSNVNKEDDPCGSGLRLLEQLNHAGGSNMAPLVSDDLCTKTTPELPQSKLAGRGTTLTQSRVTTTTSNNVPTTNGTEHDNLLKTEDFIKDIKGARYTQGGSYISGYADSNEELQTVVTRHAQMTGSNWHLDKLVSAGLSDKARVAFLKKFNNRGKTRLFWMMNKGEPNILYDCVPFATGGIEQISCKHAIKQRSKDVSLCKCDARIYVRSIWRFPSFAFEIAGNEKISDIRKAMRRHLEHLYASIAAGDFPPVERYYFSLPTARAHTSHKVPEFPRPGTHFTALHSTLVEKMLKFLQTGNSFITEVTEHIAQCSLVALALNPSDESLQVSREKVNGHIYHMLKDGEIALPEPLSVLTGEQIRCTHFPHQEPSGTLLACSDIPDSSGREEDLDPCGDDQESERLGDEEKIDLDGERAEVLSLLNALGSRVYACNDIKYLQKLRRTLTDENCGMPSILCDHRRKRSVNTTGTPSPKKLA